MGWICRVCTLINENNEAAACEVCQTRREDVPVQRSKTAVKAASNSRQITLFGQVVEAKTSKDKKPTRKASPQRVAPKIQGKKTSVPEQAQFHLPYETLASQAKSLLRDVFGFTELRGLQPQAVECALRRQSQIVIMATGGGKSLCYQLPALTLGGTTLVVSPLKALIADQVQLLVKKGIAAAFLSSQLTDAAKTDVMERVLQRSLRSRSKPADSASWKGKYVNLLYCTPEMVQTERFRGALLELHKSRRLTGFAVDEAHCVSSWGHDFRPAYLKLNFLRETFPDLPLMACTATATPQVLADIRKFLRLEDRPCHLGSFDRKNVYYKVRYRDLLDSSMILPSASSSKPSSTGQISGAIGDMVHFIRKQHETAEKKGVECNGIVYVHRQKDTEELAQIIREQTGLRAAGYHGGMKDVDRTRIQESWTKGETPIAIATVAFGMGIDLPHVRYVIHWNMAKTVEGFYQESGRAGRDGLPAYSLLYFSKRDVSTFEYLARMKNSKEKDASVHALIALEKMVDYSTKPRCRRQYLLKFFGERDTDPKTICQKSCDFCRNPDKVTQTIEAASCVNDFTFQMRPEKEWDGQWSAPHGDNDEFGEDDGIDKSWLSRSNGLSIMGEVFECDSSLRPPGTTSSRAGFSKASDVLAKYEAMERRNVAKEQRRKGDESHPIIPEHLKKAFLEATERRDSELSRNISQKRVDTSNNPLTGGRSINSLEAEAKRLRNEMEQMRAKREALAKKSSTPSSKPLARAAPPPPPTLDFSRKKRRQR